MRHRELLFPTGSRTFGYNSYLTGGTAPDPSLHNCSPLAQFSSVTLREHADAVSRLNTQRDAILRAQQLLEEKDAAEQRREGSIVALLDREEGEALGALAANSRQLEGLATALECCVRDAEDDRRNARAEALRADAELGELDALEGELRATVDGLEAHTARLHTQRRVFADATAKGFEGLASLRQESQHASTLLHRFGPGRTVADSIIGGSSSGSSPRSSAVARAPAPFSLAASPAGRPLSPALRPRPEPVYGSRGAPEPYSPVRAAIDSTSAGAFVGHVGKPAPTSSPARAGKPLSSLGGVNSATIVFPARPGGGSPPRPSSSGGGGGTQPLSAEAQALRREAARDGTAVSMPLNSSHGALALPGSPYVATASFVDKVRADTAAAARFPESTVALPPPESGARGSAQGGRTALHIACATGLGGADTVLALLRGSNASQMANTIDDAGNTPLHAACSATNPSLEAVHALLLAGVSTAVKNDDGLTAFHVACLNTSDVQHKLKKFLVFKGAQNPNQRTARGETAAHLCAVHDRHLESLRYLVSIGTDVKVDAMVPSEAFDSVRSPDRAVPVTRASRLTPLHVAMGAGACAARTRAFLEGMGN